MVVFLPGTAYQGIAFVCNWGYYSGYGISVHTGEQLEQCVVQERNFSCQP